MPLRQGGRDQSENLRCDRRRVGVEHRQAALAPQVFEQIGFSESAAIDDARRQRLRLVRSLPRDDLIPLLGAQGTAAQ